MLEWVLALCGSAAAPDALLAQTGIAEGVIAFVLAIQVLHKFFNQLLQIRIRMFFLDLPDPDPSLFFTDPDPVPSINMQK
jgi:hypothetical protein